MKNIYKLFFILLMVFSLGFSTNTFAGHHHHGWHGGWHGHHHHGWRGYYGGYGGGWYGNQINPWAVAGLIGVIGAAAGAGPYYGGYGPYYGGYGPYSPYYARPYYRPYYQPYRYRYRCAIMRGHVDPYGYWIPRQRVCW